MSIRKPPIYSTILIIRRKIIVYRYCLFLTLSGKISALAQNYVGKLYGKLR